MALVQSLAKRGRRDASSLELRSALMSVPLPPGLGMNSYPYTTSVFKTSSIWTTCHEEELQIDKYFILPQTYVP